MIKLNITPQSHPVMEDTFEVTATDEDVSPSDIRYELESQNPPGYFEFLSASSNKIQLIKPLDFNRHQEHRLQM